MTSRELNLQLQTIKAAQTVTSIYQQVAAMRMRRIKDTVIQNRNFYNSLSQVYNETWSYYLRHVKNDQGTTVVFNKRANGGSVAVLLTANTGLYGTVIRDTYDLFMKDQQDAGNDVVIVGRLGKNWIQAPEKFKNIKFFDLPDGTDVMDSGIREIFNYISTYQNIYVYHGIFKNIAQQPPHVTKVTEQIKVTETKDETSSFLFEPTIGKVLEVFEKQLLYSFFDQSFYESALAKYGSRMMSLDEVTQQTAKDLNKLEMSLIRMKHQKQNRRQIELLSGINLWR